MKKSILKNFLLSLIVIASIQPVFALANDESPIPVTATDIQEGETTISKEEREWIIRCIFYPARIGLAISALHLVGKIGLAAFNIIPREQVAPNFKEIITIGLLPITLPTVAIGCSALKRKYSNWRNQNNAPQEQIAVN